ncbi:1-acyl-sn-glycerol-3-phosphate acyltransferase [Emticicia sp. SJ17W-69]|uniref:1-acyl-sn-glycerol-3-phosphate acyltransferase n=1 Tax=Emticicia sp. SJ17W-69 TaxID=3421657 RepID=UPI003EBE5A48
MLYYTLRPFVTFVLKLFIKNISISGLENIPKSGAVMLASTHANSFFDAILLCCTIDRRVWSLARGDVFKKSWAKKILTSLFMLPVYRLSEGKEHLGDNDETFNRCIELFQKGEVVLIFSEGICVNQTKLLPLKKGTARLAQKAWRDGMELTVVPVAISYDTILDFGKKINLNIGKTIIKNDFPTIGEDGFFLKTFNDLLTDKMNILIDRTFPKVSFIKSLLFSISSIINFPANKLACFISKKLTKGVVFFDSIALGLLIFLLPIYWLLLIYVICFIDKLF